MRKKRMNIHIMRSHDVTRHESLSSPPPPHPQIFLTMGQLLVSGQPRRFFYKQLDSA